LTSNSTLIIGAFNGERCKHRVQQFAFRFDWSQSGTEVSGIAIWAFLAVGYPVLRALRAKYLPTGRMLKRIIWGWDV
jgi:hypothetical protein